MENNILTDKYGRTLDYLRISVTDRCNFRCYYCMPERGIDFASQNELLSWDELHKVVKIFCEAGVKKIRITGGEPFVRNGILPFLEKISRIVGLEEISITTNGSFGLEQIEILERLNIRKINVSLDSLDKQRFHHITRRDNFDKVFENIQTLLNKNFDLKLNCVVSDNKNIEDIIPFVELTKTQKLTVRFLEEMPFNGSDSFMVPEWNYQKMYSHIAAHFVEIIKLNDEANSTSLNYKVQGFAGTFGIIPSYSRTFCGTCNRIRLSATGELRTCLYGPAAANLKDELRNGASNIEIQNLAATAVKGKLYDGFEAQAMNNKKAFKSMSVLGG